MVYRRARSSKRSRRSKSRRSRTRRAGFAANAETLAKMKEAEALAELKRVRAENARLRKELGLETTRRNKSGKYFNQGVWGAGRKKKRSRRRSRK